MERRVITEIRQSDAGSILLTWLSTRFTYCSQVAWEGFIASGDLTVNGERCEATLVLHTGDLVSFAPTLEEPPVDRVYSIVRETPDWLVVDKPPNLPCHHGGRFFKHTLWYLLGQDYGSVHFISRLDRETSGLVLIARNPREARRLQDLQAENRIRKTYLAMVHGDFPPCLIAKGFLLPDTASKVRKKRRYLGIATDKDSGTDELPDRTSTPSTIKDVLVGTGSFIDSTPPGAETCETRFALVKSTGDLSLVRAHLITGRTHQIRATLFSLGFPIVGDKLYGLDEGFFLRFVGGTLSASDRSLLRMDHQALHAERLEFADKNGEMVDISSPPRFGL